MSQGFSLSQCDSHALNLPTDAIQRLQDLITAPLCVSSSSRPCDLQYEYFNAVLINEVDELGNSVELGGEFVLQPNDHFNNLSVNLSLSVVQVPTNMYNKGMFTGSDSQWRPNGLCVGKG